MKAGSQALEAFLVATHPLDLEGLANVARCMVWDGNPDEAFVLVKQGTASLNRNGGWRANQAFYQLLGMSSVLAGVIGSRNHMRTMRKRRAEDRRYNKLMGRAR